MDSYRYQPVVAVWNKLLVVIAETRVYFTNISLDIDGNQNNIWRQIDTSMEHGQLKQLTEGSPQYYIQYGSELYISRQFDNIPILIIIDLEYLYQKFHNMTNVEVWPTESPTPRPTFARGPGGNGGNVNRRLLTMD